MMFKLLVLLLFALSIVNADEFSVYAKEKTNDFNETYVKVKGFERELLLKIGVGTPKVLRVETLSQDIKLLHCFGGNLGTSTMVGYFYTYILDFKNQKIIGFVEYYNDYKQYNKYDKTAKWLLVNDTVEAIYYDEDLKKRKMVFQLR